MEAEKTPDNVVILNHDPIVDPLRQGLLLLCRQLGRPLGDAELVDGMPLEHGRLPLHLVARALRRADITAQVTRQPLRRIDRYLLPALLLLDDGRALVLVGNDGEHAEVLVPQSDGGSQRMPLAELEALYSGTAVFAKCRYRPDGRVGDYASALPEHWFFGPLKRLWRSYAEVTAAALVANVLAVASALFAMQVYDRVVPNAAFDTLWILASGVALAIVLDGVLRIMRGHLLNVLGKRLDLQLSTPAVLPRAEHPGRRQAGVDGRLQYPGAGVRVGARVLYLVQRGADQRPAVRGDLPADHRRDRRPCGLGAAGGLRADDPAGAADPAPARPPVAAEPARRGDEERRAAGSLRAPGDGQGDPRRRPLPAPVGNPDRRTGRYGDEDPYPGLDPELLGEHRPAALLRRRGGLRRLSDQRGRDDRRRPGGLLDPRLAGHRTAVAGGRHPRSLAAHQGGDGRPRPTDERRAGATPGQALRAQGAPAGTLPAWRACAWPTATARRWSTCRP
ncbi:ABC transporter ATP-binding protein/permease [Pseudomonas aeruginosa]|nr:ABC transporter ATP-binding protein/permease [Pseudomonas aeruginosa]